MQPFELKKEIDAVKQELSKPDNGPMEEYLEDYLLDLYHELEQQKQQQEDDFYHEDYFENNKDRI